MSLLLKTFLSGSAFILVFGCGQLKLGDSVWNDPLPTGSAIKSGTFTGGASGTAYVYRNLPSADVIRLELISAPSPYTSYKVVGYYSGGPPQGVNLSPLQLKSSSGNMNFSTGLSSSPSWTKVQIELVSNPNPGIGVATAPFD